MQALKALFKKVKKELHKRWRRLMAGGKKTKLASFLILCGAGLLTLGVLGEITGLWLSRGRRISAWMGIGGALFIILPILWRLSDEKNHFRFQDDKEKKSDKQKID